MIKTKLLFLAMFTIILVNSSFATVYMMRGHMIKHNFGTPGSPIYVSRFVCGGGKDEVCAEVTVYDGLPNIVYCSPLNPAPTMIPVGALISGNDFSGQFAGYNTYSDINGDDVHEWIYNPAPGAPAN